jgi:hypothetical protein
VQAFLEAGHEAAPVTAAVVFATAARFAATARGGFALRSFATAARLAAAAMATVTAALRGAAARLATAARSSFALGSFAATARLAAAIAAMEATLVARTLAAAAQPVDRTAAGRSTTARLTTRRLTTTAATQEVAERHGVGGADHQQGGSSQRGQSKTLHDKHSFREERGYTARPFRRCWLFRSRSHSRPWQRA